MKRQTRGSRTPAGPCVSGTSALENPRPAGVCVDGRNAQGYSDLVPLEWARAGDGNSAQGAETESSGQESEGVAHHRQQRVSAQSAVGARHGAARNCRRNCARVCRRGRSLFRARASPGLAGSASHSDFLDGSGYDYAGMGGTAGLQNALPQRYLVLNARPKTFYLRRTPACCYRERASSGCGSAPFLPRRISHPSVSQEAQYRTRGQHQQRPDSCPVRHRFQQTPHQRPKQI